MIDDLVGGLIGSALGDSLGEGLRASVFARKLRSIARRDAGSTRATLVRPNGSCLRYWRGSIVRSGDCLQWRPSVRRWRAVDLSDAAVVGWSPTKSLWRGDYLLVELARVDPIRQLRVIADRIEVVHALFGEERWLGRTAPRYSRRQRNVAE